MIKKMMLGVRTVMLKSVLRFYDCMKTRERNVLKLVDQKRKRSFETTNEPTKPTIVGDDYI